VEDVLGRLWSLPSQGCGDAQLKIDLRSSSSSSASSAGSPIVGSTIVNVDGGYAQWPSLAFHASPGLFLVFLPFPQHELSVRSV
jgi:hypothetical protein